jgi:hypothetical protein
VDLGPTALDSAALDNAGRAFLMEILREVLWTKKSFRWAVAPTFLIPQVFKPGTDL